MSKITAIRAGRGRRVRICLDGRQALGLEAEVAAKHGLQVGQELSEKRMEELTHSNSFQRCLNAATRYLGYRPRSESELRDRLHRRGFDDGDIDNVINRLKEQGLVDDRAFAEFWKENRQEFSPRSQRLTGLELRQKGIEPDIIKQMVDTVDDTENAYRAALSKARSLSQYDYQGFSRRLGGYLKRRGFSYAVVDHTIERLWRENETFSKER
ncbi:MAG: RecX family transcriptional regulator [Chloroflexi bacterium]|nr:RecX family transcriptional regulator [Chloroflexota bacterium]